MNLHLPWVFVRVDRSAIHAASFARVNSSNTAACTSSPYSVSGSCALLNWIMAPFGSSILSLERLILKSEEPAMKRRRRLNAISAWLNTGATHQKFAPSLVDIPACSKSHHKWENVLPIFVEAVVTVKR